MTKGEFNVQIFKTEPQWSSGLSRRLKLDADGISLFANPAFDSWLVVEDWADATGDIVTDDCGQTYWSAIEHVGEGRRRKRNWSLFRHNPYTGQVERVIRFKDCGRLDPRKMWLRGNYLWVLDRGGNRVLAMSLGDFQIIYEIDIAGTLIDVDLDQKGTFYALVEEDGKKKICSYSSPPLRQSDCFTLKDCEEPLPKECKDPVALAVGRAGLLYLLDAERGRFIRVNPADKKEEDIGASSEKLLKEFKPSAMQVKEFKPIVMQIDDRGVIYLASDERSEDEPARLHLFDEDGSYLGETTQNDKGEIISWNGIRLPEQIHRISGIGFDSNGGVYLATDYGLAKFGLSITPVGQNGVYYSKTLDNGRQEGLWHRLALSGHMPEKTSVEVYYYANDNAALKSAYDRELSSDKSLEEKEKEIEKLLKPLWKGPEVFEGKAARDEKGREVCDGNTVRDNSVADMSIMENKGRFLWLKLRLITFAGESRPAIRAARVYYPRLSYLRYLPPTYREEPVSAAFLERFLSLFETIFQGLELEIDQLHRYFNPRESPAGFLRWLASWINLSIDEYLPEERVRRLIRRAPELYSRKGTPAALTEFLEIYTGRPVSLIEHSRGLRPFVIGEPGLQLGRGTILLGSGVKGFRVGDTSVIGYSALRDKSRYPDRTLDPDEPFLKVARRFTIMLDMDREEFNLREATLRRILDEQKPAHTICTIRLVSDQGIAGSAVLGVSASVTETLPYHVGITPLGSGLAVAKGERVMRVERGAWVGSSVRL